MITMDVRQAFTALRARTGLSGTAFAELLGYASAADIAPYAYPEGSWPHAHLPDELIERMLENLTGEGHPAITRADIMGLSLLQEGDAFNLAEQLTTPSLLADILIAFDHAVTNTPELAGQASINVKANQSAKLYKQLNTGAINQIELSLLGPEITRSGTVLDEVQRELILEDLLARSMLLDLIEVQVQSSGTVAFLGHMMKSRYGGRPLQQQSKDDLRSIHRELAAIAGAHEAPAAEEAENVVMLSRFRK
ncbi:MAG: hypothetical protein AAGI06_10885 [Pseudomonadota bacterium]